MIPTTPGCIWPMAMLLALLLSAALAAASSSPPPPLASLAGAVLKIDAALPRDLPVLTNFWGSVGTDQDVLSLSQVLLPPYLDIGVATARIAIENTTVPLDAFQWTPTGTRRWGGAFASETRMLFEGNGVLQQVTARASDAAPLSGVTIELRGCMRAYPGGLGWTQQLPRSTADFNVSLTSVGAPALLSCDTQSPACAIVVVVGGDGGGAAFQWSLVGGDTGVAALADISAGTSATLNILLVVAPSAAEAIRDAAAVVRDFDGAWQAYARGWEARWLDAFTPKATGGGGGGHYSGSLPLLTLEASTRGAAIEKLYYMSVFTILAGERTNLPLLFPRVYLTATGNQWLGFSVGGTLQYAWDQSFYGTVGALLDPAAARADLAAWIGQPIDAHFGIELDSMKAGGYFYAYNAVSLFRTFSAYVRTTNDTAFLAHGADAYLETLANFYRAYVTQPNSTLADYSSDANAYLECVPSYRYATAGLQGGNAAMALDLADLRAAQGNASGAAELRARAASIAHETIERMYVAQTSSSRTGGGAPGDVGGWWRVIDTRGTGGTNSTHEVRHCIDFAYAASGFCAPRWPAACSLNASVRAQMSDFALRQLVVDGGRAWMAALSPLDEVAPIARPDHGTTGAYDAWPALTFDTLAALAGFEVAVPFLESVARAADEGPLGQAHAIAPNGGGAFKTTQGWTRYVANAGGAFAESIVGRVFGYEPSWLQGGDALPAPLLPTRARGLRGALACVRLASGRYMTATLADVGVEFAWDASCDA